MKTLLSIGFLLTVAVSVLAGNGQLKIGGDALHTDVMMVSTGGGKYSLADLKGENGLVVIFSCNTCPVVRAWEDRYNGVYEWAKANEAGMAVLNSNDRNRDGEDSLNEMKKHAEEKGYLFPYLVDDESLIANAFGAQTTPHVFLFDKDFKLVYKGAIDDNYKNSEEVKKHYLREALSSLSSGKTIAVTETNPVGCSIKRKLP